MWRGYGHENYFRRQNNGIICAQNLMRILSGEFNCGLIGLGTRITEKDFIRTRMSG